MSIPSASYALQALEDLLKRLRRKPRPPCDPCPDKLAPVRRGPKGRSGAAVAEPEEESTGYFPPRAL